MKIQTKFLVLIVAILASLSALVWAFSQQYIAHMNEQWALQLTERHVQFDKQRTLQPMIREINLARKLAVEPAIINMALHGDDPKLKLEAINLLEAYRLEFRDHSYFAAFAQTGRYYFNDANNQFWGRQLRYTLDKNDPEAKWFFATMASGKDYQLNVERSANLDVTKVWVNVLIKQGPQVLGVIGTGLDITKFLKETVDIVQPGIHSLFVDGDMAIQLYLDPKLIDFASISKQARQRNKVDLLLKDPADIENLRHMMAQLQTSSQKVGTTWVTFEGQRHLLGVAYLPELDWYALTLMDAEGLSSSDGLAYAPLLLGLLLLLALFTIGLMLHLWVLQPIGKLQAAMNEIQHGHYNINPPLLGSGEILQLSKKFLAMVKFVRDSNATLEDKVEQRTQFEQFRSSILELLTGEEPLPGILKAIVLGVEQLNPQMLCSILLLDSDGKHLTDGVAPSLPASYNAIIDGVEIGLGVGSCGTAAFTGQRVIVEDIATHPYWMPYKALALNSGLGACWSQPICTAAGQVLGTFAIYHREVNVPTKEDINLIEQAANLCSIAIERKQAELALKIAATAFESQEGMLVTNAKNIILRVNSAFTEITGYSAEEAIGKTPQLLSSGKQDKAFYTAMWAKINNTGAWEGEIWNRRKSGEVYPQQLTVTAVKDVNGGVTNYVATLTDITMSKAASEAIKSLAFYDPLTQLPNRRLLNDRLSQAMSASKRSNAYGALMFLDLDNFKPLNDTHGHVVGDRLLIEAALRLTSSMRDMDAVARFGGDEFVVMLAELDTDKAASISQAAIVAEKIRAALSEPYVFTITHDAQPDITVEHSCTASIGVVMFIDHESNQDDIMKWADAAMYEAKDAGRNQIRFYEASQHV